MRARGQAPLLARGFTLIEMIIALAIVGLISLLLFSGLRLGSRAWEGVETVSRRISDLRLVDEFLARTLTQAYPATAPFDGAAVPVFAGDAQHLEVVAPLSAHVGQAGLYILRFDVEELPSGSGLVLTRWLLHPEVLEGGDDFPVWEPFEEQGVEAVADYPVNMDTADGAFGRTLLLERLSLFEIAYYGRAEGETEPGWHEEWLEQPSPPSLARIRMATQAQSWPDLLLPLPVEP